MQYITIKEPARHVAGYVSENLEVVSLQFGGAEAVADLKALLHRALNTWDTAPKWATELDAAINGVPLPVGRPETAP